ncbi:hypothetical protein GMA8713_01817 [Grimontia marina]|uniref:Uncharacterized protein n=1 Tax=Grimontia marina TaxID=646534 RepID=A0A128F4R6_9GAMM|nr:hypothetical protein GMA8713_01817 [Grimontia marina]
MASISGDNTNNNLVGTTDDDEIYGLLGNDTLVVMKVTTPRMAILLNQKLRSYLQILMILTRYKKIHLSVSPCHSLIFRLAKRKALVMPF